jgi:hypothetical protein
MRAVTTVRDSPKYQAWLWIYLERGDVSRNLKLAWRSLVVTDWTSLNFTCRMLSKLKLKRILTEVKNLTNSCLFYKCYSLTKYKE